MLTDECMHKLAEAGLDILPFISFGNDGSTKLAHGDMNSTQSVILTRLGDAYRVSGITNYTDLLEAASRSIACGYGYMLQKEQDFVAMHKYEPGMSADDLPDSISTVHDLMGQRCTVEWGITESGRLIIVHLVLTHEQA